MCEADAESCVEHRPPWGTACEFDPCDPRTFFIPAPFSLLKHSFTNTTATMGACCGKPDRKGQGYVLGGSNTSSNASAQPEGQRLGTAAGKAKAQQTTPSQGQALGGDTPTPPAQRPQGELSASALAAQKRAEAVSILVLSFLMLIADQQCYLELMYRRFFFCLALYHDMPFQAERRGVKQGGGQLSKKLAEEKKKSPFAVEEPMPEPTNVSCTRLMNV